MHGANAVSDTPFTNSLSHMCAWMACLQVERASAMVLLGMINTTPPSGRDRVWWMGVLYSPCSTINRPNSRINVNDNAYNSTIGGFHNDVWLCGCVVLCCVE